MPRRWEESYLSKPLTMNTLPTSSLTKLKSYTQLIRMDKPIGLYLLLWPTLWAVWIAGNGQPHLHIVIVFVIGTVLMRSAGCIINDFADRKFDGHVVRTKNRPLITGAVSITEALSLFLLLCLISFALVLTLNWFTIKLAFLALGLAMLYPFTKRFTHFPQFFLGLAFSWGIPMAFAAETNTIPNIAWWLFAISVLWAFVYDTMYAMVDREDDLQIGIKSTAIIFGKSDKLIIGIIQLIVLALLFWIGYSSDLNLWFYIGWGITIGLSLYQQYLIRNREPQACLRAFLNNHWLGLAIFVGIVLSLA